MNNNFDPNLFNMMLNMMNAMFPNMGYNMNNYNMNNYQNLMNIIMNNQMLFQMYQNMQNNMNQLQNNNNFNNRMNFINVNQNQNQMNNNQVSGGALNNNNANFSYNVSTSMNFSPVTNIIFTTMKEQKANLIAPIDMKIKDLLFKYVTKLGLGPNVMGTSLFFLFNGKKINFNEEQTIHEYGLENSHTITLEYFQNISLYIDIKNIQKNYIPELSIKIEYINAENEEGEEIEMEKEDMYSLYLTLYIAIPLLIMLVALIIYLCCKKQDTGLLGGEIRVIGFSNDNETGEENEENKSKAHKLNENKKKLIVLFKTILSARKYEKTHNKIDCPRCTICYEDFEVSNSVVSITPCQHIFHYKCINNWLNQNILNPKCPNCNFDLMTIDISKLKNKPQNVLNKLPVKRESSVNENLLNKVNKDSKKSRHTLNNDINITRNRRRNYINGYSNNNRRTITISHMSFNYNLSGNSDNKKSKDCNANTNKRSNDEENEDEKESGKYDDNQNIYSSQNCLNEEDEKIENNNINNIYKMKKNNNSSKKSEDKTDNSCRISNENSERTIINKKNNKIEMIKNSEIVNTEENESENKSNKEYDDITSINITDSKKSYNNESSSKKEEYKTLSQDIKNSMKKPLN